MLADYLGGEWLEQLKTWPAAWAPEPALPKG
jgi:hypothetical protein